MASDPEAIFLLHCNFSGVIRIHLGKGEPDGYQKNND